MRRPELLRAFVREAVLDEIVTAFDVARLLVPDRPDEISSDSEDDIESGEEGDLIDAPVSLPAEDRDEPIYDLSSPSRYFTWKDLTRSGTAKSLKIDNTPPDSEKENLARLARNILDPLNDALGGTLEIGSAYRAPDVNRRVRGAAKNSQHMYGQAADISADGLGAKELANKIVELGLPFDQLIWYDTGHVHVSHKSSGNRGRTLHAPRSGGYKKWVPDVS